MASTYRATRTHSAPTSGSAGDMHNGNGQDDHLDGLELDSGRLQLGRRVYENVREEDLQLFEGSQGILGDGAFGFVVKCRFQGQLLAVKRMRLNAGHQGQRVLWRDIDTIMRCTGKCPFIVECHGYIVTQHEVLLCMELMTTCLHNLQERRGRAPLPERVLARVSFSVVEALNFLKEKNQTMHRDVKPSNILLHWTGSVKLCDFGLAGYLVDSLAISTSMGANAYLAPERVSDCQQPYGAQADVWSLGITLVELATGHYPYGRRSQFLLHCAIAEEDAPRLPEDMEFSDALRHFVISCLQKDPGERARIRDLRDSPFYEAAKADDFDIGGWCATEFRCLG